MATWWSSDRVAADSPLPRPIPCTTPECTPESPVLRGARGHVRIHHVQESSMAVKIRLRRVGRKKAPMYRIVVADSKSPRDGKFIEIIGQYAPRQAEGSLNVDVERANYWLDNGAQPSDTTRSLLRKAGVLKARH